MMSPVRLGAGIAIGLALVACGADSLSAFGDSSTNPGATADGGAFSDGPSGAAGTNTPSLDTGVILVHAAGAGAFRLCFLNELDRLPQPDSTVMPAANVVGVDVGTAVRINPLRGAPGHVIFYDEIALRAFYGPNGSNPTLTCKQLQNTPQIPYTDLGEVTDNLSVGVHVLVVTGCQGTTLGSPRTAAQCGSDYDTVKNNPAGNLHVVHKSLLGVPRVGASVLPLQVMDLALPLESARAGRAISLSFHDGAGAGADTVVASNVAFLDDPQPAAPAQIPFDGSDAGAYQSYTLRVDMAETDGGATPLLEQSLADIQDLSSPRDVPPSYYAQASNFVLLLLGDPALPLLGDGGADPDPYRNLHLLAVPVIEPKADAGADAGDGG
jgi:hypothetical protein